MRAAVIAGDGGRVINPSHHERGLVAVWLGNAVGTFVDVGAGDPIRGSQTYHLELNGWQGLLIEPSVELAKALETTRKAPVVPVACAGPGSPATIQLWLLGWEARAYLFPGDQPSGVMRVAARRLDDILMEAEITSFDFLSVDVGGTEADVLAGFTASRFKPRLILIDDRVDFGRSRRLLRAHDYVLVRRTGHNAWFVPRAVGGMAFADRVTLAWHYGPARLARRLLRRVLS
ncbi:FkbM family methyltransferase [Xanthobacter sp.]|uniref:FkbM family methyltransferase n=1 Tax=Xanthobacter sp. TaxID=35809 RepID=UPI0025ED6B76|nr:FkbM family methyltransferase [Xanthobacter sp.]